MAPRPVVALRHAGALTLAREGPAGEAKAKPVKSNPATASAKTAPRSGTARGRKQAAARPEAEASPREPLVKQLSMLFAKQLQCRCILLHFAYYACGSSFSDYFNVTTLRGRLSLQTWASRVIPGVTLVPPACDDEGLRVGDCTLQSIAAMGYKTGRCGGADLVMMHPCEDSGSCKHNLQASKVIHLIKEKVMEPR